jgi:hypothetical protein
MREVLDWWAGNRNAPEQDLEPVLRHGLACARANELQAEAEDVVHYSGLQLFLVFANHLLVNNVTTTSIPIEFENGVSEHGVGTPPLRNGCPMAIQVVCASSCHFRLPRVDYIGVEQ